MLFFKIFVLQHAYNLGCRRVTGYVDDNDANLPRWYQGYGFVDFSRQFDYHIYSLSDDPLEKFVHEHDPFTKPNDLGLDIDSLMWMVKGNGTDWRNKMNLKSSPFCGYKSCCPYPVLCHKLMPVPPSKFAWAPLFFWGGGTHATQIHMYVISRYTEEHIVRSTLYGQQNVIKIKPDLIISGCLDIIYSKNVFASYFCFFKFRGSKLSFELGWCHVVAAFSKDPCNISLVIYVVNINLSLLQSIGDFVDQSMSLWKNKVL